MTAFQRCCACVCMMLLLMNCNHKKPVLSGDEPVEVTDFIDFFPAVSVPYQLGDTIFARKEKDSLLISIKVFTQFIPDSVLRKVFPKSIKPKIYPIAKVKVAKGETYLFVKVVGGDNRAVFLLGLDDENTFVAGMPLMRRTSSTSMIQSVVMDRKYSIMRNTIRRNADGSISEGKDVYILNSAAKDYMLIMTDPLDDKITELVNPIDTFARKHKLSADYLTNKMNIVSIRDGRKSDRLNFFIHFEKNNGECTGELKGEALIRSVNLAEYRQPGDPCVLQFSFTGNSVTLKEQEGCGSHRGLRCLFAGTYPRKKVAKPPTAPKRTARKK